MNREQQEIEDKRQRKLLLYIILITAIVSYVILSCFATVVQGAADYNSVGFKEMKWGDKPQREMQLLDRRGPYSFYCYETDESINNIEIERVTYKFCNDKLCSVAGKIKGGYDEFVEFHNYFIEVYGPPSSYHPYYWNWYGETNLMLYYDNMYKDGYFFYFNMPLHTEILNEKMKERIEKKRLKNQITKTKK
jgi:hypothetical protein